MKNTHHLPTYDKRARQVMQAKGARIVPQVERVFVLTAEEAERAAWNEKVEIMKEMKERNRKRSVK